MNNPASFFEGAISSTYAESYADFFSTTAADKEVHHRNDADHQTEWFGPETDFQAIADEDEEAVTVSISGGTTGQSEIQRLLDLVEEQAKKLEAANYRIGYLESQSENYKERIALLTDSQSSHGWWRRLRTFVAGGGKQPV